LPRCSAAGRPRPRCPKIAAPRVPAPVAPRLRHRAHCRRPEASQSPPPLPGDWRPPPSPSVVRREAGGAAAGLAAESGKDGSRASAGPCAAMSAEMIKKGFSASDERGDRLHVGIPGEENPGILADLGDEAVDEGAPGRL